MKSMNFVKNQNPWHFSHLGEAYFKKVANNLRAAAIEDAQIKDLYIGCTGVAYAEKNNGRKVNPNWCVRMNNGNEFKYGTPIKNKLEQSESKYREVFEKLLKYIDEQTKALNDRIEGSLINHHKKIFLISFII